MRSEKGISTADVECRMRNAKMWKCGKYMCLSIYTSEENEKSLQICFVFCIYICHNTEVQHSFEWYWVYGICIVVICVIFSTVIHYTRLLNVE